MPTIQQPGKAKVEFLHLKTKQSNCRCCGRGKTTICDDCHNLFKKGYAFFLEVTNDSTEAARKPTGYAIAFEASKAYFPDNPAESIEPALYFIRETELKKFLGNGYSRPPGFTGHKSKTKFLNKTPRWRGNNPNNKPAGGTRSPTELAHS